MIVAGPAKLIVALYQSLYRAACHRKTFTPELLPDFDDAIALHVVIPYALDLDAQPFVLLRPIAA